MQGTITRSKARWVYLGEMSCKYFLNLGKRNCIYKSITQVKIVVKDQ